LFTNKRVSKYFVLQKRVSTFSLKFLLVCFRHLLKFMSVLNGQCENDGDLKYSLTIYPVAVQITCNGIWSVLFV